MKWLGQVNVYEANGGKFQRCILREGTKIYFRRLELLQLRHAQSEVLEMIVWHRVFYPQDNTPEVEMPLKEIGQRGSRGVSGIPASPLVVDTNIQDILCDVELELMK